MLITPHTQLKSVPIMRLLVVFAAIAIGACSGIDVVPDPTDTFVNTGYSRYAWRSEPPTRVATSKDKLPQKSPFIRASFEETMTELGYQRVDKENAEFLVEYLVTTGHNDGQLLHGGSNEMLYPSSVNRQIDGASEDNAYALQGTVETGDIALVFFDAKSAEVIWRVQMSIVVENANRIDDEEVQKAVRQGLSALPPAS